MRHGLGDFNLKSPMWGGRGILPALGVNDLYQILESKDLGLLLSKGTITRISDSAKQASSTLDLSFGTAGIEARLIPCFTHPVTKGLDKGSDHILIETSLDFR